MEGIKFYKRAFISAGVVSYEDNNEGILLLQKDTIEKALNTFKNKPVILTHEGIEERGKVIDCYYDNDTGYFICIFYVDDPYIQDLLDNEGYAVSCTYDCLEYGNAGIYHNIPYDEEATDIVFKNLAIVEKPRYQEAKEYINGISGDCENGGKGSGIKGHKTAKPITIDGRKKFTDYKDLSQKARQYYKDNLQNKTVYKESLGNIEFYKKGIEETINKGNPRYIFKVLDIIRTGEVKEPEPLYKERTDTKLPFDILKNKIKYKGNTSDVLVKIRNTEKNKVIKDFYIIEDNKKD